MWDELMMIQKNDLNYSIWDEKLDDDLQSPVKSPIFFQILLKRIPQTTHVSIIREYLKFN